MRSCVRSCGIRTELVVVARSCMTLVRRYLSLRSCLRSCCQVLGTPVVIRETGLTIIVLELELELTITMLELV